MYGKAESGSEGESAEDRMREETIQTAIARQRAETIRQEEAKAREEARIRQRFRKKEELESRGGIESREKDKLKEKARLKEEAIQRNVGGNIRLPNTKISPKKRNPTVVGAG
jgi:hypothetical protein